MTTTQAINLLENMPEADFQEFLSSLPSRTQILVRGGMVSWKETLAEWLIAREN
jgi:Mg/Co/Ni transporter MgtE